MSSPLIGLVTIGQSPREDVVLGLRDVLPGTFTVVESGALDGLTREEVNALAPKSDDYPLHTRMANGQSVTIAKRLIIPRIQSCIDQLNTKEVDIITLLCTGAFPAFRSSAPLWVPNQMVDDIIQSALDDQRRIAVLLPLSSQIQPIHEHFDNDARLLLFSLAPSGDSTAINQVVQRLKDARVDLVFLRCFSYSVAMRDAITTRTSIPILSACSLLAKKLVQTMDEF